MGPRRGRQHVQRRHLHPAGGHARQGRRPRLLQPRRRRRRWPAPRARSAPSTARPTAHAAMEPVNCTVQAQDGAATVWPRPRCRASHATTWPRCGHRRRQGRPARALLGQASAGARGRLRGAGRRHRARHARRPVQTIWSREEDTRHDFYRPACVSRFQAGSMPTVAGGPAHLRQAIMPNVLKRSRPARRGSGQDHVRGRLRPALRVAQRAHRPRNRRPAGTGRLLALGRPFAPCLFKESFLDEVAAAAGRDPVAFRAALLAQHPRHCCAAAGRRAGRSGQPLAPADDGSPRARGVALHQSFGSIVAQVAEVSLGRDQRRQAHPRASWCAWWIAARRSTRT